MLKVLIDCTAITPNPSGVGLYITQLLNYLYCIQAQAKIHLTTSYQPGLKNWLRGNLKSPLNLQEYRPKAIPLPVRLSNPLLEYWPQLFPLLFERKLENPHIIHGPAYTIFPYKKSKKVITIFDITFAKYPQYADRVAQHYSVQVRKCLQWTDLVLTISENSKRDIVEYFQVDPNKIWVTPLASRYNPGKLDLQNSQTSPNIIDIQKAPYLLFVSTIEPRKNISTLITAFNYLKKQYHIPHNLILIGKKGWKYEPIFEAITTSPYRDHIHHVNYLPDSDLPHFYRNATAFVYPSHYEGFGLPVLEAMTLGAPVITSNTSCIPEVAGDAAILINPQDPHQLASAILQVIEDNALRQSLIEKGYHQAAKFSWEQTALETLAAYRSLL
ncbi:glycosyltransferase family 4 protein [Prochlorothrix hollandica]|uniref:Glycosyl transferase family 1 n=1 Tax=Prochlorothrix hollandica PCC 9006 = CALU 1027 TaxID=317619 RepID=A0A0M2PR96_PROHO|nr:glycosyltransferase family 1 protein [Prochlorothrix hollandica]KKI99040.1 glycosyl transferase family 1 [Prochlorothrix hollandica PCC 9006 = CALU 1027]